MSVRNFFQGGRSKLFFVVMAVFLVSVLFFFLISRFVYGDLVVAKVDKAQIKLSDYKERLFTMTGQGTPKDPLGQDKYNKESALNDLIKGKIIEAEAKSRNIIVSESALNKYLEESLPVYKTVKDKNSREAYKKVARQNVLESLLRERTENWREGYFLLCRYDRYLQDDYFGKTEESQKLLAVQKPYAKSYCEKMVSRLENKQSGYQKELKVLTDDKVIGSSAWKPFNMTMGREFDKDNFKRGNLVLGTNLYEKIESLPIKKGIQLVEVDAYKDTDSNSDPVTAMYAVVSLEGVGQNTSIEDFDNWIISLTKKDNIVKYLDRINL